VDPIVNYVGQHLAQELGVVQGAPILSLVMAAVMGASLLLGFRLYYGRLIETLKERHALKDEQIADLRGRLEKSTTNVRRPSRRPAGDQ